MAILKSKVESAKTGQELVNLIKGDPGVTLKSSGGKEGQAWNISGKTGTIPLNTHQAKNFDVAKKDLIKALDAAGLFGQPAAAATKPKDPFKGGNPNR